MITLIFVTAVLPDKHELVRCLHALGHDPHAKTVRHGNDGRHQRLVIRIDGDIAHETLVDLELINREPFEIAQTGIAGAKIVQ